MNVSELTGADLDYWVAKAEGYDPIRQRESAEGDRVCINKIRNLDGSLVPIPLWTYRPSTDWAYGGPIIEHERISLLAASVNGGSSPIKWFANVIGMPAPAGYGCTMLEAGLRAYVASKFGAMVPDEETSS